MATYKSKPAIVDRNAAEIYDHFSDLSRLQDMLDKLPADQRAKVGDVTFTPDSIRISTPQVGDIVFVVKERIAPSTIVFGTESSPVPLEMRVDIDSYDEGKSQVTAAIDVEIPAIVRPLIGPKLQEAADKFGELISGLSF